MASSFVPMLLVVITITTTALITTTRAQYPGNPMAAMMAMGMGGGGPGAGMPHMPMPGGHAGHPPHPAATMSNSYPQVRSSHCRYLINAPSPWGVNASPFKLYTRSYAGEVRRGYPVEVSVLPLYDIFKSFNFTDFAIWSEPLHAGAQSPPPPTGMGGAWGGGATQPAPPMQSTVSHVGVWKVFPQYAAGSSSLKCNMYSKGEDTVGTFEGRMLELLKAQFPTDARLTNFHPTARNGVAFLWYPDDNALHSGAIKFVAKLKSFDQWFHLESSPWKVYVPPPPPPRRTRPPVNFNNLIEQYSNFNQRAIAMERKLEQAQNGAV